MSGSLVLQTVVDALASGALYALVALGIAVVFGIMRLINFAHGELLMITAYALVIAAPLPLVVRIVVVVVITAVASLLMERIAFRPVRGANPAVLLITSFAISYLLQNVALMIFGTLPKSTLLAPALSHSATIGSVRVPYYSLATIACGGVVLALLAVLVQRTRFGMQMRAAAENFEMARLIGVRANRIIATAFVIAGVLAAVAGFFLVVQSGSASPTMGVTPLLFGFVAVILGGMGSLGGAVAGGFFLGTVSAVLQASLPLELRDYRDALVFVAVFLVLVVRPQGLFVARALVGRAEGTESAADVGAPATAFYSLAPLRNRLPVLLLLGAVISAGALLGSVGSEAFQATVTNALVLLVIVLGMFVFIGNSGIFSFGHIAFVAIGAYTTALLMMDPAQKQFSVPGLPHALAQAHLPAVVATLAGGALTALIATAISIPLLRLAGLSAILGTFAVLIIVNDVAGNWNGLTGGMEGLSGIPTETGVLAALAWALVALIVVFAYQETRSCLKLRASREDESAARAVGVNVRRERRRALVLSAFICGIGGGLFAQTTGTIVPSAFYLSMTFITLAMLVVGGQHSLSGAVLGVIVVTIIMKGMSTLEDGVSFGGSEFTLPAGSAQIALALAMLGILLLRPSGLTHGRELELRHLVSWPRALLARAAASRPPEAAQLCQSERGASTARGGDDTHQDIAVGVSRGAVGNDVLQEGENQST